MTHVNKPLTEHTIEVFISKYPSYTDERIINLLLSKMRLQNKIKSKNHTKVVRLISKIDFDKQIICNDRHCSCIKVDDGMLKYFPYFKDIHKDEIELNFSSSVLLIFSEWLNIDFHIEAVDEYKIDDVSYDPVEMLFFLDYIDAPNIFFSCFFELASQNLNKSDLFKFTHQFSQFINHCK